MKFLAILFFGLIAIIGTLAALGGPRWLRELAHKYLPFLFPANPPEPDFQDAQPTGKVILDWYNELTEKQQAHTSKVLLQFKSIYPTQSDYQQLIADYLEHLEIEEDDEDFSIYEFDLLHYALVTSEKATEQSKEAMQSLNDYMKARRHVRSEFTQWSVGIYVFYSYNNPPAQRTTTDEDEIEEDENQVDGADSPTPTGDDQKLQLVQDLKQQPKHGKNIKKV